MQINSVNNISIGKVDAGTGTVTIQFDTDSVGSNTLILTSLAGG